MKRLVIFVKSHVAVVQPDGAQRRVHVGDAGGVSELDVGAVEAAAGRSRGRDLGIRVVDEVERVGSVLPPSRRWENGRATSELLRGTSAVRVSGEVSDALRAAQKYTGRYVLLVAARKIDPGEDPGEGVFRRARVLGIWRRPRPQ